MLFELNLCRAESCLFRYEPLITKTTSNQASNNYLLRWKHTSQGWARAHSGTHPLRLQEAAPSETTSLQPPTGQSGQNTAVLWPLHPPCPPRRCPQWPRLRSVTNKLAATGLTAVPVLRLFRAASGAPARAAHHSSPDCVKHAGGPCRGGSASRSVTHEPQVRPVNYRLNS